MNYLAWDIYYQVLTVQDIGYEGYPIGFLDAIRWVFDHEDLVLNETEYTDLINRVIYIRSVHINILSEMKKSKSSGSN